MFKSTMKNLQESIPKILTQAHLIGEKLQKDTSKIEIVPQEIVPQEVQGDKPKVYKFESGKGL